MEDQIKKIADACQDLDLDYEIDGDDQITIPGYGRVYYDDQPGVEPGLVAEYDGLGDPVETDEVIEELQSIC